ncbi:MAG: DNA glycosylase AlkZ-like family protein [Gaiellaceae bacterium]
MKVSAETARRFLVARHALAPARSLEGGPDAVLDVFRRLGSIQFDPLAVAGRSHDLVLHARVAGYDPAWCDGLYERREIFEAYNKGLSLVLTGELPWFRVPSRSASRTLAENADVAARVLERIRAEGPLSSLDFERERGATTDWFGVPTNSVRAVLEAYAVTGVLGLARRDGNRRYYDVVERLLPAEVLAREVPLREQLRHKLLSRYRAHGLLGVGGGGDVFGGRELFVPPAKRRWGWYVLPMVFRDRLVGRIEPRIDRAAGRVEVLGLWWEDGFAPGRAEGFVDAMRDALRAYLRFAGATRLEWASHLAAEKRLVRTSL